MPRRVVRVGQVVRGLGPLRQSVARGQSQINRGFARYQPPVIAQGRYQGGLRTVITGGYAAKTVPGSGVVTIYCGPMGLGTIWYPQAVAINTSTGAGDTSTCALYLTPLENGSALAPSTQIGGQSYAGGGDTIGLAVPPLWPGLFIVAQWTGATPGALATMQVYGEQSVLSV